MFERVFYVRDRVGRVTIVEETIGRSRPVGGDERVPLAAFVLITRYYGILSGLGLPVVRHYGRLLIWELCVEEGFFERVVGFEVTGHGASRGC